MRLVIDNLGELDITSHTGKLLFLLLYGLAEMEREAMLESEHYRGLQAIDKAVIVVAKQLVAMILPSNNGRFVKQLVMPQMSLG